MKNMKSIMIIVMMFISSIVIGQDTGYLIPESVFLMETRVSNPQTKIKEEKVKLKSTLTCPMCEHKQKEKMEKGSVEISYTCNKCDTQSSIFIDDKNMASTCCIFCAYGNTLCPDKQKMIQSIK